MNKNGKKWLELKQELRLKKQRLQAEKEQLEIELSESFVYEKYRRLSIIQNSLECTERRIDGKFVDKKRAVVQTEIPFNIAR